MRYMLDTNTVSHILKGTSAAVRQRLLAVPMAQLSISAVTEGELLFGLAKRPEAVKLHHLVKQFLLRVDVDPWDRRAASHYGAMRATLERSGQCLGNLDLMIAAHAAATDKVLVSNDQAFGRVPGVQVQDWTQG
ncbi:type II toxin-antitoxin system VapC family toxin [Pseudomonas sp. HR96]|uniref:type II toxin-antitoxin system VapC family toxin n=1 Tax=Pseudomonas sp. HR96 TaxID=1027966 RepID=UPI002A7665D7|nr:type II toxin-antitoxin system VapC family toxin [Pseudomonas sp. HR96]WPO98330.1 type II toxin-antitoxin system VapC family toxin [Pseudomonas sp. HR96]